jgi:hypothetical protein
VNWTAILTLNFLQISWGKGDWWDSRFDYTDITETHLLGTSGHWMVDTTRWRISMKFRGGKDPRARLENSATRNFQMTGSHQLCHRSPWPLSLKMEIWDQCSSATSHRCICTLSNVIAETVSKLRVSTTGSDLGLCVYNKKQLMTWWEQDRCGRCHRPSRLWNRVWEVSSL